MRIVALADTHTYHTDLDGFGQPWPAAEVLIHAGDMLQTGSVQELRAFAAWFALLPYRHKIVVAGNHDRCFETHPAQARAILGTEVHYLQDQGVTLEGVHFWGSPWQPRYHKGAFNLDPGPALANQWARIPPQTDVLITHTPPYGTGDLAAPQNHCGCKELAEALRHTRPPLHVFGHIHQNGGVWAKQGALLANVTTWEAERLWSVFAFDPDRRKAQPIFVPTSG